MNMIILKIKNSPNLLVVLHLFFSNVFPNQLQAITTEMKTSTG